MAQIFHIFLSLCFVTQGDAEIAIGAVYDESDQIMTHAFEIAVKYLNQNASDETRVVLRSRKVSNFYSTFDYIQQVCLLLEDGIHVLVGPERSHATLAVAAITEAHKIPQISPYATDFTLSLTPETLPFLLKLSSPDTFQARVMEKLARVYTWTRFALIADTSDYGRNGIAEFQREAAANHWEVGVLTYFYPDPDPSRVDLNEQLLDIKNKGFRVILMWCLAAHARVILEDAALQGMLGVGWAWLITDGITLLTNQLYPQDSAVPTSLTGLLGIRPNLGDSETTDHFLQEWIEAGYLESDLPLASRAFDAILVAGLAIRQYLADGHELTLPRSPRDACSGSLRPNSWEHGQAVMQYLKQISVPGVMGNLQFTPARFPVTASYEIVNLLEDGWNKVGQWKQNAVDEFSMNAIGVLFPGQVTHAPTDFGYDLSHLDLRIATILEFPYLIRAQGNEEVTSNDGQFAGFLVDFLDLMQEKMGFRYTMYLVPDGKYGMAVWNENRSEWNGLVQELVNGEADLVLAPFTITHDRREVIDMTLPYEDININVLMRRASAQESYWRFLEPFEWPLWYAVCASFFLCALVKSMCSFLSPFGFRGRYIQRRHKEDHKHKEAANNLNLNDSLWYSFGAWMAEGYDITPICVSGRIIHCLWWFATIVYVASYTANMAAFLTTARLESGVSSVSDLASQSEISYGTVSDSAVHHFLFAHRDNPYRLLYEYIVAHDSNVNTTIEGVNKVLNSQDQPYALIFDTPVLEQAALPPCELTTIERSFQAFGYGLGLPKGSPLTDLFDFFILHYRAHFRTKLSVKWFHVSCLFQDGGEDDGRMGVNSMGGVFVFVSIGFTGAVIALLLECVVVARRDIKKSRAAKVGPQTVFQAVHRRFNVVVSDLGNAIFGCNLLHEFGERDFTTIVVSDVTKASQASALDVNEAGARSMAEVRVKSSQAYNNQAFNGDISSEEKC